MIELFLNIHESELIEKSLSYSAWDLLSTPRKKLGLSPGMVAEPKEIVIPAVLCARGRVYGHRGRPPD